MKNNYLALGGLFACLHVLFLLLSKIVVGSELLLVLFLPLLSTIYTLKCDKKSIVMFVIATLLVCGIFEIIGTFIYVVPSLICGILYGFLRKRKVKELELLCLTSIGHIFSLFFSFFVISLLFKEVEFVNIFSSIFGLEGQKLLIITLLFLMILGFCEAFLVHVITDNELERFVSKIEKNVSVPKWFLIGGLGSFISFIILYFINNLYSLFPMMLLFVFFVPYIVSGVMNFKYKVITTSLIAVFSLISIFITKYIEDIFDIVLILFTLIPFSINNFKDIDGKHFKK